MARPGDTELDEVEAIAIVGYAGLDAIAFARMDDALEQAMIVAAAKRINELKADAREHQAQLIRKEIAEMLNG